MQTRSALSVAIPLALASTSAFASITIDPTKNDVSPAYNGTDDPWTIAGDLNIGNFVGEGQIDVTAGSIINSNRGYLGFAPGTAGTATITGSNTQWNNTGLLTVGHFGSTGTLNFLRPKHIISPHEVNGETEIKTNTATIGQCMTSRSGLAPCLQY